MDVGSSQTRARRAAVGMVGLATWFLVLSFVDRAQAIPVFARKYHTSCITCHSVYPKLNAVGEAFRRNGYQFPSDEDVLVKEEPVKLGIDAYKDMFPNSIWPSTLPSIPPVSIFAIMQNNVGLNKNSLNLPGSGLPYKQWDLALPSDIELIGEGALGRDISGFWNVGFDPAGGVGVGRVFVQFSNLFAWDPEEDDNGVHKGNRWAVLPPHALNLRIGKIDPQVLPHVITEESFPLLQFPSMPTNSFVLDATGFTLFAEQPGIEASGIIKQYWSYAVGFVNGGSASGLSVDDNTFKDVYFRVARKWYGYPLDGVVGQAGEPGKGAAKAEQRDESEYATPGLDFWREVGLETGVFGWWGKSSIANPTTGAFDNDYFHRIGLDARWQYFDLDIYGAAFWGHDPLPGYSIAPPASDGVTDHFGFFIQADYMIKPWLMAFVRYEQVKIFNLALADEEQARVVPGISITVRQNLRLSSEVYINTRHSPILGTLDTGNNPEFNDMWVTSLQWAF